MFANIFLSIDIFHVPCGFKKNYLSLIMNFQLYDENGAILLKKVKLDRQNFNVNVYIREMVSQK